MRAPVDTSSSEDESFDYYVDASASDDRTEPQRSVGSASGGGNGSGRVQPGEAGSGETMSGSAAASPKGEVVPTAPIRDRRATYEEMMLGENSDVAPAELLEIVPHVVEAVRRCVGF